MKFYTKMSAQVAHTLQTFGFLCQTGVKWQRKNTFCKLVCHQNKASFLPLLGGQFPWNLNTKRESVSFGNILAYDNSIFIVIFIIFVLRYVLFNWTIKHYDDDDVMNSFWTELRNFSNKGSFIPNLNFRVFWHTSGVHAPALVVSLQQIWALHLVAEGLFLSSVTYHLPFSRYRHTKVIPNFTIFWLPLRHRLVRYRLLAACWV